MTTGVLWLLVRGALVVAVSFASLPIDWPSPPPDEASFAPPPVPTYNPWVPSPESLVVLGVLALAACLFVFIAVRTVGRPQSIWRAVAGTEIVWALLSLVSIFSQPHAGDDFAAWLVRPIPVVIGVALGSWLGALLGLGPSHG